MVVEWVSTRYKIDVLYLNTGNRCLWLSKLAYPNLLIPSRNSKHVHSSCKRKSMFWFCIYSKLTKTTPSFNFGLAPEIKLFELLFLGNRVKQEEHTTMRRRRERCKKEHRLLHRRAGEASPFLASKIAPFDLIGEEQELECRCGVNSCPIIFVWKF